MAAGINDELNSIRKRFPLLAADPGLVYLDNAATTQKPAEVLEAVERYYSQSNANPLRGLYTLSQKATDAYENAREAVRSFINAASAEEIIFTRNATESLNLIAYSYGSGLQEGDEIVLGVQEHHSNLIPWQQLAVRSGAILRWVDCDTAGYISEETLRGAMSGRTRIVAMAQISNVLGTMQDIRRFADIAHEYGAVFVCDGAQSVPHVPVDVQQLGVDFLAFSGHKMLGPMGIGVLYGKKELLKEMPPFLFGGEMIDYVGKEGATWAELPHKFEAGTVNAAGAAGLEAAVRFYQETGFARIVEREEALGEKTFDMLSSIPYLRIIGAKDAAAHHGIFSFTMDGVHPHDIAEILSADSICVRAGHHCAQVLLKHLSISSAARVSLSFYNTEEEIEQLGASLRTVRRRMGYAE